MPHARKNFKEQAFEQYARAYGVDDVTELFNVEDPAAEQRISVQIQESSDFLKRINFATVDQLKAEKLGMDINGPISRRGPKRGPRKKVDPIDILRRMYELNEIQRDVELTWRRADSWGGKFKQFYAMWRSLVVRQRAHDILMTGWMGQFTAPETDPETHSMLQDNGIGWLQQVINHAPEKVLGLNTDGSVDEIRVGPGAGANGYENMDELVTALNEYIDKPFRRNRDIKAITGDDLVSDSRQKMYAAHVEPSEKPMIDLYIDGNQFGRRDIVGSSHFPERGLFLTPLKNLSRYTQRGTTRQKIKDDDESMALMDYYYAYEDFPVELFESVAMVHPDAISLKNKAGQWVKLADEDKWAIPEEAPAG